MACRKQLAVADVAVINKTDLSGPERLEELKAFIREQRPGAPLLETAYGRIPAAWRETLRFPVRLEAAPGRHTRDLSVTSAVLGCPAGIRREELEEVLAGGEQGPPTGSRALCVGRRRPLSGPGGRNPNLPVPGPGMPFGKGGAAGGPGGAGPASL